MNPEANQEQPTPAALPPPPIRLSDPYEILPLDQKERVQSNISRETFNYFFRKLFAGDRGARTRIINTLLHALYTECINQNIEPVWDLTNDFRVATILANINFGQRPDTTRRSRPRAAKPASQPKRGKHVGGTAD